MLAQIQPQGGIPCSENNQFKGAGTSPTQIFIIIGFWLLGLPTFFLVFVEPQLMVDPKEYC